MEIKLDLHVHSEASPDGRMPVDQIVAEARRKGLQGAAICDHDVLFRAKDPLPDPGEFLLIPGEEFSTPCGHILGLFLTRPVEWSDVPSLLRAIRDQGGLAVLAHPFERNRDPGRLLPLVPLLDGVEVWNGRANRKIPEANELAAAFAEAHALARFGGSDAHLPREIGNGFVTVTADELSLTAVRQALLRRDNPVSGVNGRHLDVARSQRTKLSKQGGGLKKRLKWWAFAGKCLAEDLCRRKESSVPRAGAEEGGTPCP